jgi:WD40 repeat protein
LSSPFPQFLISTLVDSPSPSLSHYTTRQTKTTLKKKKIKTELKNNNIRIKKKQVEYPHGVGTRVTALAWSRSNSRRVLASAGADGSVKLWLNRSLGGAHGGTVVNISGGGGGEGSKKTQSRGGGVKYSRQEQAQQQEQQDMSGGLTDWVCLFSFTYRECPALALAFSRDSSLMVTAHKTTVSLWDPQSLQQRATVICPCATDVSFSAFIEPKQSSSRGGYDFAEKQIP